MNEKGCLLCGFEELIRETEQFTRCDLCGTLSRIDATEAVPGEFPDDMYYHGILASERRWMEFIEEHSSEESQRSLLDLACGNGSFLQHAADLGWTVCGVEENPGLVKRGRENGIEIVQGNLDSFEWPAAWSFDVIRIWFALEHVGQPGDLVRSACKHLRPNGLLAIAVPNDAGWLARKVMKSPEDRFWEHPLHLHHYPPFGLERWIEGLGFELLVSEADRPTELMRDGNLPLKQAWNEAREHVPELSRIFYQLGVGRTREMLFKSG